jgi:CheY-like chemotaxis protein
MEVLHFNLPELIDEVMSNLRLQADKKKISLDFSIDEDTANWLDSDPTRLKQILSNVIGNAIKFTDEGFVNLHVYSDEIRTHFLIQDSGIGLSREQRQNLFQPFTQGDQSTTRKFGGTGLGLVLAQRFARSLGGDLTVKSSFLGRGSTFEVTIRNQVQSMPEEFGLKEPADDKLKGLKILVVDDSPEFLSLVSRLLAAHHASVVTSENGFAAVEKALHEDFDLILMDLKMPVMDGLSATKRLREAGYQKPIIAMSASDRLEDYEKCLKAGCTDEVTKPIASKKLMSLISQYSHTG